MTTQIQSINLTNSTNNNISFKKIYSIGYDTVENLQDNTFQNYLSFFNTIGGYPSYYQYLNNISSDNIITKNIGYDNGLDYNMPNCETVEEKLDTIKDYEKIFWFAFVEPKILPNLIDYTTGLCSYNMPIPNEDTKNAILFETVDKFNTLGQNAFYFQHNVNGTNVFSLPDVIPDIDGEHTNYKFTYSGIIYYTGTITTYITENNQNYNVNGLVTDFYIRRHYKENNLNKIEDIYLGKTFNKYIYSGGGTPASQDSSYSFSTNIKIKETETDNNFTVYFIVKAVYENSRVLKVIKFVDYDETLNIYPRFLIERI
jgi:hypothetical protein